jgi:hypothetical protein
MRGAKSAPTRNRAITKPRHAIAQDQTLEIEVNLGPKARALLDTVAQSFSYLPHSAQEIALSLAT